MKILYAAAQAPGRASVYRVWALRRLGHEVIVVDTLEYRSANSLLRKLEFRVAAGPNANRLNRDLLRLADEEKPDVFWADKVLLLAPQTLRTMRGLGIATVSYVIDNPFGPRRDPGWRRYVRTIPLFDLHVTQRDSSIPEYRRRGAKDVMKELIGYEPTMHFPPPPPWTDAQRDREVSFIGMPYDDRGKVLTQVSEAGTPLAVSGNAEAWRRKLSAGAFAKIVRGGELWGDAYREGIWRSKINLSFVTHANLDECAQKTFEIAASGGFLLAERSEGHARLFAEDEEAVFFSTADELIAKAQRYLPDEAARDRIAAAGQARALRDGYANDMQVGRILDRLRVDGAGQRTA